MKLVKMAWILGGVVAFGLGGAAEGCSSSSGQQEVGGTSCATLSACCATLSPANAMMCTGTLSQNNDSSCATLLGEIEASNLCTGTTIPGSGTSTTPGSGTSTLPGSGTSTLPGSGTSTTPGSGTGVTSSSDAGTGADCEAPPTKVYAETTAGVYCPFSAVDGGKNLTCAAGQTCCEPAEGSGASTCVAAGTACAAMATSWGCEGTPDCSGTAGTVCCGTGTIKQAPACGAYPASAYVSEFTASSCAATCPSTGFQICSQTSECPSGQTCTPIKPKGNTIGYCAP